MSDKTISELKQDEAAFFDRSATKRTTYSQIPLEADIRRATRLIPTRPDQELIDPHMNDILDGACRNRYLGAVAHHPGGRVLDICCGPGWLALELGRRGQIVDAYDLSPKAIALAKRMLAENPYKEGFGAVNYHLQDVTEVDLGIERYDAVSGWSAFHHLPDVEGFMDRVLIALKPGGIVATEDDMPRGRADVWLERFFRNLLPSHYQTYREKVSHILNRLTGVTPEPEEIFSPMEAAKHSSVFDIDRIWRTKFHLLFAVQFSAFVLGPAMSIKGPDWFRYSTIRTLVLLDRLLCRMGVCKGFVRIMIARKK